MELAKRILISVVIPMHNAEKTIASCLNSIVCEQDDEDIEIVVVDDGSTDASSSIVNSFHEKRNIEYVHQKNQGPYEARRNGILKAKGEYILCLDSDDVLTGRTIASLKKVIEEYQEVDFIWFQHDVLSNLNVPADKGIESLNGRGFFPANKIEEVKSAIFRGLSNELWSKAIKRELLLNERNNHPCKLGEDFSQLLDAIVGAKSCYVIDEILYRYSDNATNSLANSYSNIAVNDIILLSHQLIDMGNRCGGSCRDAAVEGVAAQIYNLVRISLHNKCKIKTWLNKLTVLIDDCLKERVPSFQSTKLIIFVTLLKTNNAFLIVRYVATIESLKKMVKSG